MTSSTRSDETWFPELSRYRRRAAAHTGWQAGHLSRLPLKSAPKATILARWGDFVGRLAGSGDLGRKTQHLGFRNAISAFVGVMMKGQTAQSTRSGEKTRKLALGARHRPTSGDGDDLGSSMSISKLVAYDAVGNMEAAPVKAVSLRTGSCSRRAKAPRQRRAP